VKPQAGTVCVLMLMGEVEATGGAHVPYLGMSAPLPVIRRGAYITTKNVVTYAPPARALNAKSFLNLPQQFPSSLTHSRRAAIVN